MKVRVLEKHIIEDCGVDSFTNELYNLIVNRYKGSNVENINIIDFNDLYNLNIGKYSEEVSKKIRQDILTSLSYLCSPRIKLFKMVYEYQHGMFMARINLKKINKALETGEFENPFTGTLDPDFATKLYISYDLTVRAKALLK